MVVIATICSSIDELKSSPMINITTLNTHSYNGHSWQKGQTGDDAKQLEIDAAKHQGVVSGHMGFNGTTGYQIIDGVIFNSEDNRDKFIAEFGATYNAEPTTKELKPGIDKNDFDF